MPDRVVGVGVDPRYQGRVDTLAGRGDQHAGGACLQVQRGIVAGPEFAGRLDHQVDAEVSPGEGVRCPVSGVRRE